LNDRYNWGEIEKKNGIWKLAGIGGYLAKRLQMTFLKVSRGQLSQLKMVEDTRPRRRRGGGKNKG